MEAFDHSITLGMKTCCLDPQNSEDGTNFRLNGGSKLCSGIRGWESWDSEPRDPRRDQSSSTSLGSDGGQQNSLRPSGGSFDHS